MAHCCYRIKVSYHQQGRGSQGGVTHLQTDETAAHVCFGKLADENWHLCRSDTDTEAIDHTPDNQHSNILRRGHEDAAYTPNSDGRVQCSATTQMILFAVSKRLASARQGSRMETLAHRDEA